MSLRHLHRMLLAAAGIVLAVGVFVFTQQMIERLSQQVTATSRVLARFLAQATLPATRNTELQRILSDVIENIDFPVVITDTLGTPRAWRRISVARDLVEAESLDSLEAGLPVAPVIRARIARVRAEAAEMDRHNEPIEMRHGSGIRIGLVHYGDPPVLRDLRWVPLVSVTAVVVLLAFGLAGLASMRAAEKRTIWVGMAKETAHQLGTPLSSLMGWIELLRDRAVTGPVTANELAETVHEMDRDVDRLNKVAQRFSRVGSAPNLTPEDVRPVVGGVVSYMRRRLPHGTRGVELVERYDEVPPVMLNAELVEWTLENLIANAVSSLDQKAGTITVAIARGEGGGVEIAVTDTGRGMTPAEQRRVFEPGYTTKRRGWGLGLALARRVVEDYHRGRIFVRAQCPGGGHDDGRAVPRSEGVAGQRALSGGRCVPRRSAGRRSRRGSTAGVPCRPPPRGRAGRWRA